MQTAIKRPLPVWDADTEGYWIGTRAHKLMVKKCKRCGFVTFPPQPVCGRCTSFEAEWVPTSGRGRIYTWTTVFRSVRPEFVADVPYVLAVVELDDFPAARVPARLHGVGPLDAKVGANVEVRFEDVTPEVSLPYWVLAGTETPQLS